MNLPIAQSILHGALRPSNLPDIAFQALARKFNNLPSNLNDIEKLFISELGNYAVFDFEKAIAIILWNRKRYLGISEANSQQRTSDHETNRPLRTGDP